MIPILNDYFTLLAELHRGIKEAIDGLPAEALDWIPGADMNAITVLVTHTAGSQRFWIGDIAGQDPSNRHRPAEFETRGKSVEELRQLLDSVLAHSRMILEKMTPESLEARHQTGDPDREVTGGWAVLHALEHTAIHLGHIELTRQLWDQETGRPEA